MSKTIKRVRKSIKGRREREGYGFTKDSSLPIDLLTDEERHGLPSDYMYVSRGDKLDKYSSSLKPAYYRSFQRQLIASIFFLFLSFLLVKVESDRLDAGKHFLQTAFSTSFPFAKVHDFYVQHLGMPLSLVPNRGSLDAVSDPHQLPLHGQVVESFSRNGVGIHIMPEDDHQVRASTKGIVIFAGVRADTDKTIVIQHADGSEATYGKLDDIHVHLFEFVQAQDVIGSMDRDKEAETLFFSIEGKAGYMDPVNLLEVDDED